MNRTRTWIAATLLSLAACGGATAHPADEGDAEDHRAMAQHEEALARQHRTTGIGETAGESPAVDMSRADDGAGDVFVPAGRHQARAALHEQYAREHEAVADSLIDFHAPTCHGMESETLVVCPLLGPIASVEDIDDGIELTLADGVDRDALLARIQCHISFAGAGRGASIHQCPLYLPGVSAVAGEGAHRILLRTSSPDDVRRLRLHVRQHLPDPELRRTEPAGE